LSKPSEHHTQTKWAPFGRTDDQFSPEVVAADSRPLPRSVSLSFAVLLGFLAAAVAWSALATFDRVVESEASLVSRNPRQFIRPHTTSVLAEMPVRAGTIFRTGDVLVQFDPTLSSAEHERLKALVEALRLERDRLQLEATINAEAAALLEVPAHASWAGTLQEDIFQMRLSEWRTRTAADAIKAANLEQDRVTLAARVALLSEQIQRVSAEIVTKRRGVENGLVPRDQLFELEVRLMTLRGELIKLEGELDQSTLQVQLIQAEQQGYFASFRRNASEELEAVTRTLAEKEEQLLKAEYLGAQDSIVSNFDGVVLDAMERAPGTVVQPGDTLLIAARFADAADLEVEATIRPRDVGWVRVGMPARVKLAALPSSKHGHLVGEVVSISADAVQGERQIRDNAPRRDDRRGEVGHRALLRITANQLKNLPADFTLSPGMIATAEIIIGERRPYEYFLEPFLDGASRVLTEAN
jgi:HlyD family type I secretion membrane fusion protein